MCESDHQLPLGVSAQRFCLTPIGGPYLNPVDTPRTVPKPAIRPLTTLQIAPVIRPAQVLVLHAGS
jgi:hypothetical protein